MRARTEIRAAIGGLLVIQLATSLGAIGLLSRMSPAVARILEENVYSLKAVEDMLYALVTRAHDRDAQEHFERALGRARSNVTEPAENDHLATIEQAYPGAFEGQSEALDTTVAGLEGLASVNHESMVRQEQRASQLGTAGAWAASFLGLLGFAVTIMMVRRLDRRVTHPLGELQTTLGAIRAGDSHRRCKSRNVPDELEEVADIINDLLDEREEREQASKQRAIALDRAALLHLLDRNPVPTVVLDASGAIKASNRRALGILDGPDGAEFRHALVARLDNDTVEPDLHIEALGDGGWLCSVEDGWLERVLLPSDAEPM